MCCGQILFSTFRITIFEETGLLNKWINNLWPHDQECSNEISSLNARQLDISDVQASFYILGVLVSVASLVLAAELLLFRQKENMLRLEPPNSSGDRSTI